MIDKVGIIGYGQMGKGIAIVSALNGHPVHIFGRNEQRLDQSILAIHSRLERLSDQQQGNISLTRTLCLEDLLGCDLVIEAITEIKSEKEGLIERLRELGYRNILATNTSSFSITDLASKSPDPERFLGMHFMYPVWLMPGVEVVKGLRTSEETMAAARQYITSLKKNDYQCNDYPGFMTTSIILPYIVAALNAYEIGIASIGVFDASARDSFHHPMGPFELADAIGLDTILLTLSNLFERTSNQAYRPPEILRQMVSAGFIGNKPGSLGGFYLYGEEGVLLGGVGKKVKVNLMIEGRYFRG